LSVNRESGGGGCCALSVVQLGPRLMQCGLGRDLRPPYQVASSSTEPFDHSTPTGQRSRSTGRTVTCRPNGRPKTTEPVEINRLKCWPFGLWTRVDPRNHVYRPIRWGSRSPMQRGNFEGQGRPIANTAELIEMPFGIWTLVCPRKHYYMRMRIGATW